MTYSIKKYTIKRAIILKDHYSEDIKVMSLKKSEQIGANQYCVTFDASRESFDAAVTKVYKKAVRNISIPGFRKGKAPRSIVEKNVRQGSFL